MFNTPAFVSAPVARKAAIAPLKALVLETDFSPETDGVLPVALAIAERTGAVVHLVHVLAPAAGSVMPWREQQAQARLASTRMQYRNSLLGRALMQTAVLTPDDARDALAAYVRKEGADLVVGAMDRAGARGADTAYPVLFVPPGNPAALRRLVSIGASRELAALLGQALSLTVTKLGRDGAHNFRSDALLVA